MFLFECRHQWTLDRMQVLSNANHLQSVADSGEPERLDMRFDPSRDGFQGAGGVRAENQRGSGQSGDREEDCSSELSADVEGDGVTLI